MTTQPEALRLADVMSTADADMSLTDGFIWVKISPTELDDAAAELRRLHEVATAQEALVDDLLAREKHWMEMHDVAVKQADTLDAANQELLKALRSLVFATEGVSINDYNEEAHDIAVNKARAALAKVGGQHE